MPFRMLLALVLVLLSFTGAPVAAAPAGQTANTLVIDTTAEAESLDPALVTQASGYSIISSVFDNLVERDYSGALVPMLAESWSFPDPNTVEFKLRQGVVFHNGEPFNAAAVKYSIDRLLDPELKSPLAGGWPKAYQSVEVVDENTVRFHLSTPDATIFDTLAQSASIVAPLYYSQNSEDFLSANPVGTGPFKFVESVRDDHTTLARNPSYWGVDTYKGTPLVPTVTFRPVPDAGTRMADLLNGTADMIFDVSPDDLDTMRARAGEGFQVVTGNAAKLQFIEFMPKKATDPLADRRVRQALNLAVDADAIITNLFKGLGTRQSSPILTGALGYDPSLPAYEYNPTLAKQAANTLDQDIRANLYSRIAQLLRDNPMGIYLANDVSIYGVGPRATGW